MNWTVPSTQTIHMHLEHNIFLEVDMLMTFIVKDIKGQFHIYDDPESNDWRSYREGSLAEGLCEDGGSDILANCTMFRGWETEVCRHM